MGVIKMQNLLTIMAKTTYGSSSTYGFEGFEPFAGAEIWAIISIILAIVGGILVHFPEPSNKVNLLLFLSFYFYDKIYIYQNHTI